MRDFRVSAFEGRFGWLVHPRREARVIGSVRPVRGWRAQDADSAPLRGPLPLGLFRTKAEAADAVWEAHRAAESRKGRS